MTGEITLRGRILGVGGLKEKLLAAKQHGIKTVLLPADNKDDVEEFKAELGEGLECIFVSNMDEVMPHVFEKNPFELISRKKNGNGKQPKKAQSAQRVNKKKKR
jgi:ATP-dependent Lon protease